MTADLPLVTTLHTAVGLLEGHQELRQQILRGCDRILNFNIRIAIFGPFNFGKSTLLNALLGDRLLPMDLIPTTGAAITVKAGNELRTRITLTDGRDLDESGTNLLKEYAILDDQRQMRGEVASVEVFSPAALLTEGVEFIDLPGTNDREAQDAVVQNQLLQADLVIQVVDGRQLMTLLEREQLRDWLLDQGISTVVFVVNFLNLVEPEDQKQVMTRLRFIAESFRHHLPAGISNLYRVDALPALRARISGDGTALTQSGLPMLEAALHSFIATPQQDLLNLRMPRIQKLSAQVLKGLRDQVDLLEAQQAEQQQRHEQRRAIKRKAQALLRQDFGVKTQKLETWLKLDTLLPQYQASATLALQEGSFEAWVSQTFRPAWIEYQKAVVAPIHKACEFFEQPHPADLWVAFPDLPSVQSTVSQPPSTSNARSGADVTPVAIATGVGLLLSGPVGAAVLGGASYLLNQKEKSGDATAPSDPAGSTQVQAQVRDYLIQFSEAAAVALQNYQVATRSILQDAIPEESAAHPMQNHQLQLIRSVQEQLCEQLAPLKTGAEGQAYS
ncbi:MAG: dynamin [Chloroflexi bacterium AL-N5]|nr:dynamin [Chloroflexi bacterium AL-N5]